MKLTYRHTLRACYTGYVVQAIVNNLAPLLFVIFQRQFTISYEEIGRLILINFTTQIVVDLLAMKLVDRMGYRRSTVLAHALNVLGLVGLSVLPGLLPSPYAGLLVSVVIYAMGGGLLEVLVSPIVNALPGEEKASAMSILHSFYCWGQMGVVLFTTLFLWLLGDGAWTALPLLWALIPAFNLVLFLKVPMPPTVSEDEAVPLRKLVKSGFFRLALIVMLCAGAAELTMSQWSSLFAEKGLQVPKVVGDLAGPCLFAFFMGIGRMLYGKFGKRIRMRHALAISGGLCVICYGITVFSPSPLLALLGCAFSGLSVSLMWPGTFSLCAGHFPMGGTAMFGLMAFFGDLGGAVGPWLSGVVSDVAQDIPLLRQLGESLSWSGDQLGLKCGLLIGVLFPLLLLLSTAAMGEKGKPKTEASVLES